MGTKERTGARYVLFNDNNKVVNYGNDLNQMAIEARSHYAITNDNYRVWDVDAERDVYWWPSFIEDKQRCRVCGCTWDRACPGGCYWVLENLCSECAKKSKEGVA